MKKDFSNTNIVELAAIIANHLARHEIQAVLVGGLAVEIYSDNLYLTNDIDMVNTSYDTPAKINKALKELGFEKKGRVYQNASTDICLEFPSAPLSVGDTIIQETTVFDSSAGRIPILLARDVVKDRLSAYFHWKDQQSLVQALAVMSKKHIRLSEIRKFCMTEGRAEDYALIEKLFNALKRKKFKSTKDIEELVLKQLFDNL